MKSPHLFPLWFLIRRLQPKYIIENGVWKGQGTWFIEKAAPNAQLYCLDPNLTRLVYKSQQAYYSTTDFSQHDWSHIPKDQTLVFFDDHQNALQRIKAAQKMGFHYLMFEDNYPPGRGDTYSLKKALTMTGYRPQIYYPKIKFLNLLVALKVYITQVLNKSFVAPNKEDAVYLRNVLQTYYEFPPVIRPETTRWNDPWTNQLYPTQKTLFSSHRGKGLETYINEGKSYNWICYVELK